MAHARRSLRNHHGKPHEHAPGDPLGEYLPPLADWGGRGKSKTWWHPMLGWKFTIIDDGARVNGYVQLAPDGRDPYVILVRPNGKPMPMSFHFPTRDEQSTYAWMKDWYSRLNVREMAMADGSPLRLSARNPDWSAIRAKATHYGSRAATGAREAYAWTAPRAKRAAEVTWEGAKSAGRAVKRGAKRAAPVVARGARSAAEGLDRWSQTNGRCSMRNGAAIDEKSLLTLARKWWRVTHENRGSIKDASLTFGERHGVTICWIMSAGRDVAHAKGNGRQAAMDNLARALSADIADASQFLAAKKRRSRAK